ncbi:armadillo-like helical domain-containing protein 4 isoform X4 [Dunckerocampus dactyliophorus]|uniref:armadillo-like helical domain-containing protein 4 isoform X4 n=1 Tax=Dunckerocampus dactyliophorus TaxID=161453 RepID=UPI00240491A4|nr:armadillo-like helical domain-containing protein 4 isoform X4 [Dunckerocampus dactyliophorus]
MLMLHTLHHFILAGACLCVCGSPVQQDPAARGGAPKTSKSRDGSHVSGLVLEVGAGSRGPAWRHGGVAVLLQNRDSLHVESRLSTSDMRRGTQEAAGTGSLKKGNLEAVLTSPRTRTPRDKEDRQDGDQDAQTRQISSTEHPNTSFGIHSPASSSTIPPSTSPPTFTPLPLWDNEGALMATPPEALLPDIEPNMMPKEDGMESLWTEAARPGGADTAAPPSQDDATEGTMSSESLPLIFEPLEESVEDGAPLPTAAMATGGAPLSEADLELLVTWETDKGASQLEDPDDEHSEESVEEEESEEDLIETTKTSLTQPPYSLIPPPPIWVQRNQGLMRSWVALIREKAGYVSGMLAPVGIGIAGALLIVGALYGVRRLQRKRRNSFKHQRRKVRQAEQPREVDTSRQDQAMLLADSSEDEF